MCKRFHAKLGYMLAANASVLGRDERSALDLLKLAVWPVFVIVLSLVIYLWLQPSAGMRALRRSERALQSAKSWHSVMAAKGPDGFWAIAGLRDVSCPADIDETILHADANGATRRRIETQGVTYTRSPYGGWSQQNGGQTPVVDCGRGPMVGSQFLYSDLNEIERNGEVRRGGTQNVEAGKCQWWIAAPEKGGLPRYSVCLNTGDYLPHDVVFNQAGVSASFTQWNTTTIVPPAGVAPDPQK